MRPHRPDLGRRAGPFSSVADPPLAPMSARETGSGAPGVRPLVPTEGATEARRMRDRRLRPALERVEARELLSAIIALMASQPPAAHGRLATVHADAGGG